MTSVHIPHVGNAKEWESFIPHSFFPKRTGVASVIGPHLTLRDMLTSRWGHCALKTGFPSHSSLCLGIVVSLPTFSLMWWLPPILSFLPSAKWCPLNSPLSNGVKQPAILTYTTGWLNEQESCWPVICLFLLQHPWGCSSQGFKHRTGSWIQLSLGFYIGTVTRLETYGSSGRCPFFHCF